MTQTNPPRKPPVPTRALTALAYTPLRDILHGRITAALHPAKIASDSGLPESLQRHVASITERNWVHLLRRERIKAAHELSKQLAARLETGETPAQIIDAARPLRKEARRVRQSMTRRRGFAFRWAARVMIFLAVAIPTLLVAIWLPLYLRYHSGEVVIRHDYLAMLNKTAADSPPDQRVWPPLREAILDLEQTLPYELRIDPSFALEPDSDRWRACATALDDSRDAIGAIHAAVSMPYFGYVAMFGTYEEDSALWPVQPDSPVLNEDGPGMMNVFIDLQLPYISTLRYISRVLAADAHRAAMIGDGDTATRNILACLDLARLTQEIPLLINDLVSTSQRAIAFGLIKDLLHQRPGAFSDESLRTLHDTLQALEDDALSVRFNAERWSMLDSVQRSHTDDGAGGGHFVAPQFEYLPGSGHRYTRWSGTTMAYLWSFASPGRREVERKINSMFDDPEMALPLWERGEDPDELAHLDENWRWRYSYAGLMIGILAPATSRASLASERIILDRDAAMTVVALERFRRSEGRWPEALDELVPGYLDTLPIDRFDGKPLRYINRGSDKPLLYSIGANLKDDDGVAALDRDGFPSNAKISRWIAPSKMRAIKDGTYVDDRDEWTRKVSPIENILPPDADYILWPPLPEKPVEPEPDEYSW